MCIKAEFILACQQQTHFRPRAENSVCGHEWQDLPFRDTMPFYQVNIYLLKTEK